MKSVESSEPSTPLVSTDSLSSPLRRKRKKGVAGYAFVSGYFVLLILFGVAPAIYAITLAFTASGGHFTGLTNFIKTGEDFRFLPAFENVGKYLFIWLASLVVIVLGLALMLHLSLIHIYNRSTHPKGDAEFGVRRQGGAGSEFTAHNVVGEGL